MCTAVTPVSHTDCTWICSKHLSNKEERKHVFHKWKLPQVFILLTLISCAVSHIQWHGGELWRDEMESMWCRLWRGRRAREMDGGARLARTAKSGRRDVSREKEKDRGDHGGQLGSGHLGQAQEAVTKSMSSFHLIGCRCSSLNFTQI